jgi:putative flippase GtrA
MKILISKILISMSQLLNIEEKKLRFLLIGGVNTLFGISTFSILYYLLQNSHIHYLIILFIAQLIAINFSYFSNKFLVFQTEGNFVNEYPKFFFYQILVFLLNLGPFAALVEISGIHPVIVQVILTCLMILISYIWYNRYTFIEKP